MVSFQVVGVVVPPLCSLFEVLVVSSSWGLQAFREKESCSFAVLPSGPALGNISKECLRYVMHFVVLGVYTLFRRSKKKTALRAGG